MPPSNLQCDYWCWCILWPSKRSIIYIKNFVSSKLLGGFSPPSPPGNYVHVNIKRVLVGHSWKGRSLMAVIRNVLITMPSTLTVMLPMSFIVVIKAAKGIWGLTLRYNFHKYMPYKAGECPFANIIRKLQPIIFDIQKTATKYQMIKIQNYGRARADKIVELGGTAPHATP